MVDEPILTTLFRSEQRTAMEDGDAALTSEGEGSIKGDRSIGGAENSVFGAMSNRVGMIIGGAAAAVGAGAIAVAAGKRSSSKSLHGSVKSRIEALENNEATYSEFDDEEDIDAAPQFVPVTIQPEKKSRLPGLGGGVAPYSYSYAETSKGIEVEGALRPSSANTRYTV